MLSTVNKKNRQNILKHSKLSTTFISKKGITRPLLLRSWLILFAKLLLVKEVKPGALIGQNWVKRKRESSGLVPIFDITCVLRISKQPCSQISVNQVLIILYYLRY